jgi:hypothetical protein
MFLFISVNLQAFSLSFWQDFRVEAGSFSLLGSCISSIPKLKYLSLSQSVLYPETYLVEDDEMTDVVFETMASNCKNLRDVHLGSFYAVTNATWKVCLIHCIIFYISVHVKALPATNHTN